eukprot:Gb_11343 [translate_table: standard]
MEAMRVLEMYQILAFDAMFQITLLTAVFSAHSNNKGICHIWWIPFTLSAIAGLLAHKFFAQLKNEVGQLDLESQLIIITSLSHKFKFKVFLLYLGKYWSAAALAFLFIAFSLVVLASCNAILC